MSSVPHDVTKACRDRVATTPGNSYEIELMAAPDIEPPDEMSANVKCIVFPASYSVEPLSRTLDLHTVGVGVALFKKSDNTFAASDALGVEADKIRRHLSRFDLPVTGGTASYVSTQFAGALDPVALREQGVCAIYMTATYQISTT